MKEMYFPGMLQELFKRSFPMEIFTSSSVLMLALNFLQGPSEHEISSSMAIIFFQAKPSPIVTSTAQKARTTGLRFISLLPLPEDAARFG
jgi:hypothetical protein